MPPVSALELGEMIVKHIEGKKGLPGYCVGVEVVNGYLNFRVKGQLKKGKDPIHSDTKSTEGTASKATKANKSEFGSISCRAIGVFRSCFKEKYGTPRQGAVARDARGHLELYSWVPPESLEGLDGFSHVWLIFWFHKNTNKVTSAKVSAPRLNGGKVGVFASRAPHRINPIGQTLAVVEKVDISAKRVYFSGIDLIEGTPILDIKPLHPGINPNPNPNLQLSLTALLLPLIALLLSLTALLLPLTAL
ncbi:hypothetical protein AAMO2058_001643200 [Amorphochlora amoebiformis]